MNLAEFKEKTKDMNVFDLYDYFTELEENGEDFEFYGEDVCEIILNKIVNNIDLVLSDQRIKDEKYKVIAQLFIESKDEPNFIVQFLKNELVNLVLEESELNYKLEDIESLSEEDKELFIDKLGNYLPLNIQEQLMPEKNREEIFNIKKEVVSELNNDLYNSAGAFNQTIGMNDKEKLEFIALFDREQILEIAEGMSEENKLKAIELVVGNLYSNDIKKIAEGMSEENKLKVIEIAIEKLHEWDIEKIAEGMSEKNKKVVIEKYAKELGGSRVAELVEDMDDEFKIKVIRLFGSELRYWNIEKIINKIKDEEKMLEVIKIGLNELKDDEIYLVLRRMAVRMKEDKNKLEAIKLGLDDKTSIVEMVEGMKEDKNKLEAIELGKSKLNGEDIAQIAKGMSKDENKLEAIKLVVEKVKEEDKRGFIIYTIITISEGMSDQAKLETIKLLKGEFDAYYMAQIAEGMKEDENKLEAIELLKDKGGTRSIVFISRGMSKENRKIVIEKYCKNLGGSGVAELVEDMDDEMRMWAIQQVVNSKLYYVSQSIVLIAKSMSKENRKIVIEKYCKNLGGSGVAELVEDMDDEMKMLVIHQIVNTGAEVGELIVLISKEMSKENKKIVIEKYYKNLSGSEILSIIGINEGKFASLIDTELQTGKYNSDKIIRIADIISELQDSNSGRLSRIALEIGMQVYELSYEDQDKAVEAIKQIYMTKNLPDVAKDFLIFEQLHPSFIGESKNELYSDRSAGNIPSLSQMKPQARKRAIFSDLLRIAIESNNRNLKEYILVIENGDKYFKELKDGKLKIDDKLSDEKKECLSEYAKILNSLYNQTSKGKREDKLRENNENLEQDLIELENLFNENPRINLSLPDRIVRTFGYWAGIINFEQAKQMCIDIPKMADERNRDNVRNRKIVLKEGDFVKGISGTSFFSDMLQDGIIAKDYLGESSTNDCTPLDMDVELVKYEGNDFEDTYKNLKTAPGYASDSLAGKNLGKIILVFENDGSYIQTRSGREVNNEAISRVKTNTNVKEFFDNNGIGGENAYGIRTGVGTTNIKCIIADKYVDKLGLEIAINGFYIPIVNTIGDVIFTPEMYDEIRSKMQGISHYEMTEFKLDKTAKNVEIQSLTELIDKSISDASHKREMLLKVLDKVIKENGLTMLTEREKDLLPGIVEVIDTGSTGRGTNEPGDGDFDFMVRLDSDLFKDAEAFKGKIKEALSVLGTPEKSDVTAKGDFRYKGVKIDGLDSTIDVDLTFFRRTDEIEFSTEECIKERLEIIKNQSPEDYKYVVANILLAKKFLKLAGAYKKKSAPDPENGQPDIRGGLGAVGIENWVLQNGGSFEKASRSFLEVANECESLEEFQSKYAVWDFGENYLAGDNFAHDNFVYNMNPEGFKKMQDALNKYVKDLDLMKEKNKVRESEQKGIAELVAEDREVFNNSLYMRTVYELLDRSHSQEKRAQENKYEIVH